jgi:hypothetical protein
MNYLGTDPSLVEILAAGEIGRQLGVRSRSRGGDNISTLEGATLGLLALMIGFTFSIALSRFEARRDAVLNEANAIEMTAVRAPATGTARRRIIEVAEAIRANST